jgi:hypothetical protein
LFCFVNNSIFQHFDLAQMQVGKLLMGMTRMTMMATMATMVVQMRFSLQVMAVPTIGATAGSCVGSVPHL